MNTYEFIADFHLGCAKAAHSHHTALLLQHEITGDTDYLSQAAEAAASFRKQRLASVQAAEKAGESTLNSVLIQLENLPTLEQQP